MTMDVKTEQPTSGTHPQQKCAGCGKPITDRYLLKAMDLLWHEDCLKCGCCDCRLGEMGSTLYIKSDRILCKRDYLRLYGTTGYCAACSKVIPAFEMVMRARENVYHLECFACQQCSHRFCVGDRFYLCDNKILCEYDYEERLVFANMVYNPPSIAHLKRQTGAPPPSSLPLSLPIGPNSMTSNIDLGLGSNPGSSGSGPSGSGNSVSSGIDHRRSSGGSRQPTTPTSNASHSMTTSSSVESNGFSLPDSLPK